MTTHLFEIENDRYTDRIDPAAAWVVGHTAECERTTHPNSLHPCDCGHDSRRALAVPGTVDSVLLRVNGGNGIVRVDGAWEQLHHVQGDHPIHAAVDALNARPGEAPHGFYALADGELRRVEELTDMWKRVRAKQPSFELAIHARSFLDHHSGCHLIFTNSRGDEVVVERGMLS